MMLGTRPFSGTGKATCRVIQYVRGKSNLLKPETLEAKWPKMAKNGRKMAENGPKMDENGRKWAKMAKAGRKMGEMGKGFTPSAIGGERCFEDL